MAEYKRQLADHIAHAADQQSGIRKGRVEGWAFSLVSCFTDDCIARGIDVDRGGARYNWVETSNVGLANIADSLMVIKRAVFEEGRYTLADIRELMASDFPDESARAALTRGMPRYGNDEPEVDALAGEVIEAIYGEHAKYRDYTGGWFVPGFFCWIMHGILGSQTAATPDGRHAGDVLADGSGAAQGRDVNGPTAAVKSITSWNHEPGVGGIVLNLRFSPASFTTPEERAKLVSLVRTYFALGGFETQINAVSTETLHSAQREPEKYADLLVRIAGYSDYFTLLDARMQQEVISRTEHGL
jgi:formate C-acetyltransferase